MFVHVDMIPKETSKLRSAINNDKWHEAMKILDSPENHYQITETDSHGRKPIHEACRHHDAPLELVNKLCSVSIDSISEKDNEGLSPLHYAVIFSSDEIIISLVESCPKASSVLCGYGWTPLHLAIYWDRSIAVFEALLAAAPSLVTSKYLITYNPLRYFFRKWDIGLVDFFHSLGPSMPKVLLQNQYVSDKESIPKHCTIKEIYDKAILLIWTAVHHMTPHGFDRNVFKALHACMMFNYCPWSFISLIRRFRPEEVRMTDDEGNLPLHITVANKPHTEGKIIQLRADYEKFQISLLMQLCVL